VRFETILFDLDGTLIDPRVGITRCVEAADPDSLTPHIGPPLMESFERHHGLDTATAPQAIVHHREGFAQAFLD